MRKLIQYIKDSRAELKKVVWPTRKETANYTIAVVGLSLSVAIFIGVLDYILNFLVELLISL